MLFESYFSFSLDTCPGSKIYLKGKVEVEHGFLKLYNRNVNFVGGRVDKIADNWELRKVCVIEKTHKMLSVEWFFFRRYLMICHGKRFCVNLIFYFVKITIVITTVWLFGGSYIRYLYSMLTFNSKWIFLLLL